MLPREKVLPVHSTQSQSVAGWLCCGVQDSCWWHTLSWDLEVSSAQEADMLLCSVSLRWGQAHQTKELWDWACRKTVSYAILYPPGFSSGRVFTSVRSIWHKAACSNLLPPYLNERNQCKWRGREKEDGRKRNTKEGRGSFWRRRSLNPDIMICWKWM